MLFQKILVSFVRQMDSDWRTSRMDQTNALSKTSDTLVQASQTLIPWWNISNDEEILRT